METDIKPNECIKNGTSVSLNVNVPSKSKTATDIFEFWYFRLILNKNRDITFHYYKVSK